MTSYKFNVFDKVKILDTDLIKKQWNFFADKAINQVGIITYKGPSFYLIDNNKYSINFIDEHLELVGEKDYYKILLEQLKKN